MYRCVVPIPLWLSPLPGSCWSLVRRRTSEAPARPRRKMPRRRARSTPRRRHRRAAGRMPPPPQTARSRSRESDATTPTDAATDVAVEAADDAGEDLGTDAGPDSSTSTDGGACAYVPDPVSAVCPPECTGGCADGTCHIDCSGTSPETKCMDHNYYVEPGAGAKFRGYLGPAVRCPDGMPCKIMHGRRRRVLVQCAVWRRPSVHTRLHA